MVDGAAAADNGAGAEEAEHPAKRARTDVSGRPTEGSALESQASSSWVQVDSVHVRNYSSPASARVACFDLDSALIKTKSGKPVPLASNDWTVWADEVLTKLKELSESGHKLFAISYQPSVGKGKLSLTDMQVKIDCVQKAFGLPLLVMILTQADVYRKPLIGSWRLMASRFNGSLVPSAGSFFCGGAAGRVPPAVKKKDASATDLKYALNAGVAFHTPEELFLGQSQSYEREQLAFDPRSLGKAVKTLTMPPLGSKSLVICVGAPGSGKSSLATGPYAACVRVNQDTLKTKDKCLKACKEALQAGKSVIVDNQNKARADRAPYLALAKAEGATALAVYFDVPKELCFHLNTYRMLNTKCELHRAEKVPALVIHAFYKSREVPTEKEGFSKVCTVGLQHFMPAGDADLGLLRQFLD